MSLLAKFREWLRKRRKALDVPEFKLKPRGMGDYYLMRWDPVGVYLCVAIVKSEEEAREVIAHIRKPAPELKDEP